jgi:hypothetical protein
MKKKSRKQTLYQYLVSLRNTDDDAKNDLGFEIAQNRNFPRDGVEAMRACLRRNPDKSYLETFERVIKDWEAS